MINKLSTMKKILFPILMTAVVFSCKKKEDPKDDNSTPMPVTNQMTVEINPMYGTQEMKIDSVYTTTNGDKIKFTLFKVLMENIQFSGKTIQAGLFNYANGKTLVSVEGTPASSSSFSANLGVDSLLNHNNPTQFSTDSPLNILNANDMHWSWNPGYIFFKVEAKMDTIADGTDNFDHFVNYHIGRDENLRVLNLSNVNWQSNGTSHKLVLDFDFEKFISNETSVINLRTDNISHAGAGQEAISTLVADNFRDAFSN